MVAAMLSPLDAGDFASSGYAQGGATFLRIPVYAADVSLCQSTSAWYSEMIGLQQNPAILDAAPAGLVAVSGGYTLLSLGRRHLGADVASGLGPYCVGGISFIRQGISGIEGRDDSGNFTGFFSDQENSIAATLAGRLRWASTGIRFRYLYQSLERERAQGMGADAGIVAQSKHWFSCAVSASNLLSYLWWSTGRREQVLPVIRLGINGKFLDSAVIAEIDLSKDTQQPLAMSCGLQYAIWHTLFLRCGTATSFDVRQQAMRDPDLSFGVGVRYRMAHADYALAIPSSGLGLQNSFSIRIDLLLLFDQ